MHCGSSTSVRPPPPLPLPPLTRNMTSSYTMPMIVCPIPPSSSSRSLHFAPSPPFAILLNSLPLLSLLFSLLLLLSSLLYSPSTITAKGPAMVLNTLPFFNGLRKLLENKSENGLLMANVWAVNLTLTREIAAKYPLFPFSPPPLFLLLL